jgi:lysophospholipase L1-like esterase
MTLPIDRRNFLRALAVSPALARFGESVSRAESGETKPLFGPRERIVFFGDSITQGGSYVAYLETLLRLRFPQSSLEIHNHGISSETISGTSEPDHDPRRPWAHERFTRDVADWHPTILLSCFGMNDGNYHPFEEDRFAKYREGIQRLIDRAKNEAGARQTILCTPPPFDPYQRKNGDPKATHYGYKYAAVNYDETLGRYAQWLLTLREQGQAVADLHGPMNRHLAERRKKRVSFTLMPDAVHPDATGHAVMAITLAKQIGLTGPRATISIAPDLASAKVDRGTIIATNSQENSLELDLSLPACWRFGASVDPESLELENASEAFDAIRIVLEKPLDGMFEITFSEGPDAAPYFRKANGRELSEGIRIVPSADGNSPASQAGKRIAEAVMKHRQSAAAQWRGRAMKLPKDAEARGPQLEELATEAAAAAELSKLAGTLVPGARLKIRRLPT